MRNKSVISEARDIRLAVELIELEAHGVHEMEVLADRLRGFGVAPDEAALELGEAGRDPEALAIDDDASYEMRDLDVDIAEHLRHAMFAKGVRVLMRERISGVRIDVRMRSLAARGANTNGVTISTAMIAMTTRSSKTNCLTTRMS